MKMATELLNDLLGLLLMVLFSIPLANSTNIECNGKSFHCINSTHFMICVDIGNGITRTIDDFVINCPPITTCHVNNVFECEFPKVEVSPPLYVVNEIVTYDINGIPPIVDNITDYTLPIDLTISVKNPETVPSTLSTIAPREIKLLEHLKEQYTGGNEKVLENIDAPKLTTVKYINTIVTQNDIVSQATSNEVSSTFTPNINSKQNINQNRPPDNIPISIEATPFALNLLPFNDITLLNHSSVTEMNNANVISPDNASLISPAVDIVKVNNNVLTNLLTTEKNAEIILPTQVEILENIKEKYTGGNEKVFHDTAILDSKNFKNFKTSTIVSNSISITTSTEKSLKSATADYSLVTDAIKINKIPDHDVPINNAVSALNKPVSNFQSTIHNLFEHIITPTASTTAADTNKNRTDTVHPTEININPEYNLSNKEELTTSMSPILKRQTNYTIENTTPSMNFNVLTDTLHNVQNHTVKDIHTAPIITTNILLNNSGITGYQTKKEIQVSLNKDSINQTSSYQEPSKSIVFYNIADVKSGENTTTLDRIIKSDYNAATNTNDTTVKSVEFNNTLQRTADNTYHITAEVYKETSTIVPSPTPKHYDFIEAVSSLHNNNGENKTISISLGEKVNMPATNQNNDNNGSNTESIITAQKPLPSTFTITTNNVDTFHNTTTSVEDEVKILSMKIDGKNETNKNVEANGQINLATTENTMVHAMKKIYENHTTASDTVNIVQSMSPLNFIKDIITVNATLENTNLIKAGNPSFEIGVVNVIEGPKSFNLTPSFIHNETINVTVTQAENTNSLTNRSTNVTSEILLRDNILIEPINNTSMLDTYVNFTNVRKYGVTNKGNRSNDSLDIVTKTPNVITNITTTHESAQENIKNKTDIPTTNYTFMKPISIIAETTPLTKIYTENPLLSSTNYNSNDSISGRIDQTLNINTITQTNDINSFKNNSVPLIGTSQTIIETTDIISSTKSAYIASPTIENKLAYTTTERVPSDRILIQPKLKEDTINKTYILNNVELNKINITKISSSENTTVTTSNNNSNVISKVIDGEKTKIAGENIKEPIVVNNIFLKSINNNSQSPNISYENLQKDKAVPELIKLNKTFTSHNISNLHQTTASQMSVDIRLDKIDYSNKSFGSPNVVNSPELIYNRNNSEKSFPSVSVSSATFNQDDIKNIDSKKTITMENGNKLVHSLVNISLTSFDKRDVNNSGKPATSETNLTDYNQNRLDGLNNNVDNTSVPQSQHISDKQLTNLNEEQKYIPTVTNDDVNSATPIVCTNYTREKYADSKDCRKFYICLGKIVVGLCPNNTVFSEINKQCTRNLSHCIRNNQFHCLYEGRFSDFFKENIYYICVKNKPDGFLRYKLQCQNGYHLDKTTVKCTENVIVTSQSESSGSENSQGSNDKNESTSKSRDSGSSGKQENNFECKKEGTFPHENDCRKYYICYKKENDEYRLKIKECSDDEVYDKKKKKCTSRESND